MEKLNQFNDIIALGKLIVDELQLNQSNDTLGRWMAHHISEVMQNVEKLTGRKKTEAEDRCREAVLSLWKHISAFPKRSRPQADIEPLIETIERLDPDYSTYYYSSDIQHLLNISALSEETESWLELAQGIDYSARLLIRRCLKKAADEIAQEHSEWLDLAKSLDTDIPITGVIRYIESTDQQHGDEVEKNRQIETLIDRRDRLEAFILLSQNLAQSIDQEIADLQG